MTGLLWLLSCVWLCLVLLGCGEDDIRAGLERCAGRDVNVGFYADFVPLSHSQDNQGPPHSESYNTHRGYEADLLTAVEALENADLSFARRALAPHETTQGRTFPFADIWLLAAEPSFDLIGGGITIREDRTRNADGRQVVAFTSGHVAFRQSLLVRSGHTQRIAEHGDLTENDVVSVHRGTTGEERLLQLVGIVDEHGVLIAGTHIVTPTGTLTADGSAAYAISSAMSSSHLVERQRIIPPPPLPQVVIHASEQEQLDALRDREVTAVARGNIGNSDSAADSKDAFGVTALDSQVEYAGFAVDADDPELLVCLNAAIDLVTFERGIGYLEWATNPRVFLERAQALNARL